MRLIEMKNSTPVVRDGVLLNAAEPVQIGSEHWFQWVQSVRSFRYEAQESSFTAIKETRKGRDYWVAHKRVGGVLRRKQLGSDADLKRDWLDETAIALSSPDYRSQAKVQRVPTEIEPVSTLVSDGYTQPGQTEAIESLRQELAELKARMDRVESVGKPTA